MYWEPLRPDSRPQTLRSCILVVKLRGTQDAKSYVIRFVRFVYRSYAKWRCLASEAARIEMWWGRDQEYQEYQEPVHYTFAVKKELFNTVCKNNQTMPLVILSDRLFGREAFSMKSSFPDPFRSWSLPITSRRIIALPVSSTRDREPLHVPKLLRSPKPQCCCCCYSLQTAS